MKKIFATLAAFVLAFALGTATASTASAAVATGNVVYNYGQDYDVSAQWYDGSWWNLPSGNRLSNTQCVRPRVYMVSQWGGGYAAGQTRCFTTANNTLKLYRI